jgi:putative sterol carrier protein
MATGRDILDRVVQNMNDHPERVKDMTGRIRFDLSGEGGGSYLIRIADGAATLAEATEGDAAQATISMTAADLDALVGGTLLGMQAFMAGRIRVGGDIGLAMRLESLLH